MKKTYEKPIIIMENFELTQHIASCGVQVADVNSLKVGECSATVYIGDIKICKKDGIRTSEFENENGIKGGFANDKVCSFKISGYCETTGDAAITKAYMS